MDEDWLKVPRKWSASGIASFMVCIGPISSIFDITTFLALWYIFHANNAGGDPKGDSLFQSGWFVEGLLTQTLIVHMIRTEKIPFLQSTASSPVLLLTSAIMAVGCLLPYSPFAPAMHMTSLPGMYWPLVLATILGYWALTQIGKRLYIRKFREWM
jgi:Mg2+-importing ATPase